MSWRTSKHSLGFNFHLGTVSVKRLFLHFQKKRQKKIKRVRDKLGHYNLLFFSKTFELLCISICIRGAKNLSGEVVQGRTTSHFERGRPFIVFQEHTTHEPMLKFRFGTNSRRKYRCVLV